MPEHDEGLWELTRRCLKDAPSYRARRISLPMLENSAAAELSDTYQRSKDAETRRLVLMKSQKAIRLLGEDNDRLTRENAALREVVRGFIVHGYQVPLHQMMESAKAVYHWDLAALDAKEARDD